MIKIPATERIDALNIALMILAGIIAIIIPFQLFLFSYAILGPLHYLTEISWLHDRDYYTRRKYDYVLLAVIAVCVSLLFVQQYYKVEIDLPVTLSATLVWVGFLMAILFVTVKKALPRILGVLLILATIELSTRPAILMFTTIFLPTLIHVYVFTGLFMLYGALRSRSRIGLAAVGVLILVPILLVWIPAGTMSELAAGTRQAYTGGEKQMGFQFLHISMMQSLFDYNITVRNEAEVIPTWLHAIFNSKAGIITARLIAFAYTYHYLNWFSKTKVIQWHKVPRVRFVLVIAVWLFSVGLYLVNYTLGFVWLFFLSYLHVILELPLNVTSVIGIFKSFGKPRVGAVPNP